MIYDGFTFFNELDILEIRLNVLRDVVDRFVLVEARETFTRKPKPLYFAENRERFAPFLDRIEHVVVDEFPAEPSAALAAEIFQRNAIQRGLAQVSHGDTVMISDVDEIPRPECVRAATRHRVVIFRQLMFSYFLNYGHLDERGQLRSFWGGTVAYRHDGRAEEPQRYSELRYLPRGGKGARPANRIRALARKFRRFGEPEGQAHFFQGAGWHFTYQGGVDAIVEKVEAYSHVEFNEERFKSREAVLTAIKEKRDLFGRGGTYGVIPIDDDRFPLYLREKARTLYPHLLAPEAEIQEA